MTAAPDGVSSSLYEYWLRGADDQTCIALRTAMPVPGAIALRGRFHALSDTARSPRGPQAYQLPRETWDLQVDLATRADEAIIRHDRRAAVEALTALANSHDDGLHVLPRVEALIGFGDLARQADEWEQAAGYYEQALALAGEDNYRFGQIRALVPIGYLTLQGGSATGAIALFERAAVVAAELDERLYLANALTGRGEARGRLRHPEAADDLLAANRLFDALKAPLGAANALQHLGDLHRKDGRLDDAVDTLTRALARAADARAPIARVNALDALAETRLAQDQTELAVDLYAEAFRVSCDSGYARGEAHAANGLGRCCRRLGEPTDASELHRVARDGFLALGDPLSATVALDGLADAGRMSEDGPAERAARLDAVALVESVRAGQRRHDAQTEFSERFRAVYAAALMTAVRLDDPSAFVVVFEGLAGRRLAGLFAGLEPNGDEAVVAVQMLARADHLPRDGDDLDLLPTAERRARLVGRLALRAGLPRVVEQAVDEVGGRLYTPFDPTQAPRLLGVAAACPTLLITLLPGAASTAAWLWSPPQGRPVLGITDLTAGTALLVASLARDGLPARALPQDVAGLAELIPDVAAEALARDVDLQLVPLGALWGLPWPAVPLVGGKFLGEQAALAVLPSLTAVGHLHDQPEPPRPTTIRAWRAPGVEHHAVRAFDDDPTVDFQRIDQAPLAAAEVLRGTADLVVIAAHGRPTGDGRQYLELDRHVILTPADILAASCPRGLVLLACWGASAPGGGAADPLTLATLALARGSYTVVATTSELADDPPTTTLANSLLHALLEQAAPRALRHAFRRHLARPALRDGPLASWAPLIVIGTSTRKEPET